MAKNLFVHDCMIVWKTSEGKRPQQWATVDGFLAAMEILWTNHNEGKQKLFWAAQNILEVIN
jgi:hypothetical protein